MDKRITIALAAAALGASYGVATLVVGQRVEAEIEQLAATLTARDDVRVSRMDYERGFRRGTLHYDLTWVPEDADLQAVLAGLDMPDGVRLAGTAAVRHGPWVGGGAGFALAATHAELPLPDDWRRALPQYPGQAPLLRGHAHLTLGGGLAASVKAIDYRGRVLDPDSDTRVQLELSGLGAAVQTDVRLQRVGFELRLDGVDVSFDEDGETGRIELRGLGLEGEVTEGRPRLWVGTSTLALARAAISLQEDAFELESLRVHSDSRIDANRWNSVTTLSSGPARFGEYGIQGFESTTAVRNVDADALSEFIVLVQRPPRMENDGAVEEAAARMIALGERILAGAPTLSIDTLRIAWFEADDVVGRMQLGYEGAAVLSPGDLAALGEGLRGEAELRLKKSALRRFAALASSDGGQAAATEAEVEEAYQGVLAGLQLFPFVVESEQDVSVSAAVREGRVWVGETELGTVADLLAMAGLDRRPGVPGDGAGRLDVDAEPLFGRVELAADFEPDPWSMDLAAGGGDDLEEILGGGCVGWVNAARPDVVLDYSAGSYPLHVFARAEDDTTLAIRDPAGRWHCNDDAPDQGVDPGLVFDDPASGAYVIWVGVYELGVTEARLYFSEIGMGD